MDADGLPLIGPSVDYRKVEPINQKQTISFINHFMMHTAGFLNRFSNVCEDKLSDLSVRLQRLDTQMTLLEGKLSSISGLDQITAPSSTSTTSQPPPTAEPTPQAITNTPSATVPAPTATSTPTDNMVPAEGPESKPTKKVSEDPRYAKYFRMVSVGVPEMAVKQKMVVEGLNPDLLSNPNAAIPEADSPNPDPDSDSDFSDEKDQSDDDDSSIEFSD